MNEFNIEVSPDFGKYKNDILFTSKKICRKLVKMIDVEDFQISIKSFSSDNPYWNISGAADDPHNIWLKLNIASSNFSPDCNFGLSLSSRRRVSAGLSVTAHSASAGFVWPFSLVFFFCG